MLDRDPAAIEFMQRFRLAQGMMRERKAQGEPVVVERIRRDELVIYSGADRFYLPTGKGKGAIAGLRMNFASFGGKEFNISIPSIFVPHTAEMLTKALKKLLENPPTGYTLIGGDDELRAAGVFE